MSGPGRPADGLEHLPPAPPDEGDGEAAAAPPAPGGDDLQRRVAVLIMVVTLIGAVFAFLQAGASNRSSRAARASDDKAVEAMAELTRAAGRISVEDQIWGLAGEDGVVAMNLGTAEGEADAYAGHLAAAYGAARQALLPYTDVDDPTYRRADGTLNWQRFVELQMVPAYRAGEYQKAHAAERSAWGAKAGSYVAVVTVAAVALFLIGLSRTFPIGPGHPLVGAGVLLAAAATLWGLSVFAGPVSGPSPAAIEAYVEGLTILNSAAGEDDLRRAEEAFGRAIEARPDYPEAYMGRGSARFLLDLGRLVGPAGSEGARDDYTRAVQLNRLDPVAWGNLGAAQFWLGDLEGAAAATRRALEIDPDDLTFNMNLGLALALGDDAAAFEAQAGHIQEIMEAVPTWMRQLAVSRYLEVLDLAIRYRPATGEDLAAYRELLARTDHQIAVARRYFGTPSPAPVPAEVGPLSFDPSADGTALEVGFEVRQMVAGQRWLWRTYRNGVEDPVLSAEPEAWPFAVPDDEVVITLTQPDGFTPGVPVRVEVFIEGNLLQAGEFVP